MRHLIPFVFAAITVYCAGCASLPPPAPVTGAHRYFLEIDRPGSVYSVLKNPQIGGKMFRLVEINESGRPVSDTLHAWVQHYNGRKAFPLDAYAADIIIACHRELQPDAAQARHVLPESSGEIYVYMMQKGVLTISDYKISHYEVLIAARNAR